MDVMEATNFILETRWSEELEQAFFKKRRKSYERCIKRNPPAPNRKNYLSDQKCPSCGYATIYCCRIDPGETDNNVEFVHICVNIQCDFIELKTFASEGLSDDEIHPDYCPICEESHEVRGEMLFWTTTGVKLGADPPAYSRFFIKGVRNKPKKDKSPVS